jgi:hypothetical protein
MKRFAIVALGAVIAAFSVNACSSVPEDILYRCDPQAILPTPECIKQTSNTDAGTDAESDAEIDGSALKDDPNLDPSILPDPKACKGDCLPEPSDTSAGAWPNEPLLVWFGPKSQMPENCPEEAPAMKWERFGGLVAPPAQCEACECSVNGSCTNLPASIEIRSGTCNTSNVQTTIFDGPPNWDGTCTSANAMPAGKLCNGVPCAQSVSASPLPGPTNESCNPITEKPTATLPKHEWTEGALACNRMDLDGACKTDSDHCRPTLPSSWLHCVAREGKYNECPANYNDEKGPRWYYNDNPIDDRGCSACSCGAPKDGLCTGSLSVYGDGSCTNEFVKLPLSSADPSCGTITPQGRAVGSKTISNLSYIPGTCAVAGGEPIGAVVPNDDAMSGVVTFCCRAPAPPSSLPPLR